MDGGDKILGACVENEAGAEVFFCPILGLPIVRSQRVRTLPGFHLLSLAAGREGLARGSYQAYGDTHPCNDLEYLHQEDKVFICGEDNKAFLNQMSMQYHRYIRHELEERKAERKRLRERATERQARSLAHKQQRSVPQAPPQPVHQQQQPPPQQQQPQPQIQQLAAPVTTADSYASASEDPYAIAAEASSTVDVGSKAEIRTKTEQLAAVATAPEAAPPVSLALAVAPVAASKTSAVDPEDDLYGDVEGPVKRHKTESSYASAIGAMIGGGDSDDDE